MPQPATAPVMQLPVSAPGQIVAQPNAAVNTADKLFPQILSQLITAVDLCTTNVNAKPSA